MEFIGSKTLNERFVSFILTNYSAEEAKRISDRKNVNLIMKGDDPDNIVWYGRKDGKNKIWDWW